MAKKNFRGEFDQDDIPAELKTFKETDLITLLKKKRVDILAYDKDFLFDQLKELWKEKTFDKINTQSNIPLVLYLYFFAPEIKATKCWDTRKDETCFGISSTCFNDAYRTIGNLANEPNHIPYLECRYRHVFWSGSDFPLKLEHYWAFSTEKRENETRTVCHHPLLCELSLVKKKSEVSKTEAKVSKSIVSHT